MALSEATEEVRTTSAIGSRLQATAIRQLLTALATGSARGFAPSREPWAAASRHQPLGRSLEPEAESVPLRTLWIVLR